MLVEHSTGMKSWSGFIAAILYLPSETLEKLINEFLKFVSPSSQQLLLLYLTPTFELQHTINHLSQ